MAPDCAQSCHVTHATPPDSLKGARLVGMVCWWLKGSYCGECQSVRKRVLLVQSEVWSSSMDLRDEHNERPTLRVRVRCCEMSALCLCDR